MSSKIILGTVQFGLDYGINNRLGQPNAKQVFAMLELAAEGGIEILDTADAYGNASEILGDFNKRKPNAFKINTKFKAGQEPIDKQLRKSLDLLSVNSINTYFFHSFLDFVEFPKLIAELSRLKQNGLIKKTGISVYGNDEFEAAINAQDVDVIQFPFNLLDNRFQRGGLMQLAKEKGKELQVRSVFLQGLFFMNSKDIPQKLIPLKPHLEKIKTLARENNLEMEGLALIYALSQPEIDHVIIGVDNPEQLHKNLKAAEHRLDASIIKMIDEIAVQETGLLYPKNWN